MRPIGLQLGSCYSAVLAIMNNSWSLLVFVLFVKYYDVNCMTIVDNVGNSRLLQHTLSFRHGFVVSNIQCRRPSDIQRNINTAGTSGNVEKYTMCRFCLKRTHERSGFAKNIYHNLLIQMFHSPLEYIKLFQVVKTYV